MTPELPATLRCKRCGRETGRLFFFWGRESGRRFHEIKFRSRSGDSSNRALYVVETVTEQINVRAGQELRPEIRTSATLSCATSTVVDEGVANPSLAAATS